MAEKAGNIVDQQHIAESEKRLRALLMASSEVIYRVSPDWSHLYIEDGRGFVPHTSEPKGNWMEGFVHPQDIEKVSKASAKAIQNKTTFELEHRVIKSDGSVGWTFSRAVPIMDDNGEIIEWFGAASDITLRKQADELFEANRIDREASKRIYEGITSNTPDLMYVFNLDYRFIYANAALLTMWGRTEESAMGCSLLELGYEPWHAEMHEREIDHVVATKEMIRGEVSFPHATLGRRIYDYIFSPILNSQGEVVAIAGTTRDISDLKQAEEALKKSGEKLEQLVAERTKELKRSNDDLLQFAHVASHDLKEPMRKIKTFAGRLGNEMKDALTPDAVSYLQKIESAAARMSTMIEGVLSYSTLSNREQVFVPVDLNKVIHDIESDLEVVIQQKKAKINYQALPVLNGAPVLLYQLFYNLINNSLKFSKEDVASVISINASLANEGDRSAWKIHVADNGIGFQQEYAEHIFNSFTRLNSKDAYEGTGLGLALCKKIAERHNGTITARSNENEGALFEIILPVND